MFRFGFLGNTHVPHRKNTAQMSPIRIEPPKEVLLPMCQHIGAPATPIVKVGDTVKIGQKIAEASGYVSSPIYASVSGKVSKIENYLRPDGRNVPAIRILSDGEMSVYEDIKAPEVNDLESLVAAVRESGLVGLGGAGFPTSVKMDAVKKGAIDTVVLNGAECEPYITSDTRTMIDNAAGVKRGIEILKQYMPTVKAYIFGIEDNKPEAIAKMKETFSDAGDVFVAALPSLYPQGGEKVLIYNTTKRTVPEGKLPADVGVMVINVTSLAFIAKYIDTGMPLVEKCMTFDGSAVASPKNLIVPIGTSISHIVECAGGLKEPAGKIIFGGPMMGVCASSLDEPISKTTNAVTILNVKESTEPPVTACIHCGRCVAACPLSLNPVAFARALTLEGKEERVTRLEENKLGLCMECGCCSFVCPANRPLVQNHRIGKMEIREYKTHLAELARAKESK
ncbi:MAG: electron transport complex subunit RsxC [Clostridia bacterium]|nr:electron transport complex subunit RsxC [Clostridia bacterium]